MKRVCVLFVLLSLVSACASGRSNESAAATEAPPSMQQMEGQMQHMQELMDRIHATEDVQERQRLMDEHMQAMRQSMTMMRHMMCGQSGEHAMGRTTPCGTDELSPGETENHEEHH